MGRSSRGVTRTAEGNRQITVEKAVANIPSYSVLFLQERTTLGEIQMLAVSALCIAGSLGAAVLVIAASMLSSRISRHEDDQLADEFSPEQDSLIFPGHEKPQPPNSS